MPYDSVRVSLKASEEAFAFVRFIRANTIITNAITKPILSAIGTVLFTLPQLVFRILLSPTLVYHGLLAESELRNEGNCISSFADLQAVVCRTVLIKGKVVTEN